MSMYVHMRGMAAIQQLSTHMLHWESAGCLISSIPRLLLFVHLCWWQSTACIAWGLLLVVPLASLSLSGAFLILTQ